MSDERDDDTWLSDEQMAQCQRAEDAEELFSPVPTVMVSNGEHMPMAQTADQRRVENAFERSPTTRRADWAPPAGAFSARRVEWRPASWR